MMLPESRQTSYFQYGINKVGLCCIVQWTPVSRKAHLTKTKKKGGGGGFVGTNKGIKR